MKRILSLLLALCVTLSLAACSEADPNTGRTLDDYSETGYYSIEPADITLLEFKGAPIPELLLDHEAVTMVDVIFDKGTDGTYAATSTEAYELRQDSELDVPMYYFDAADGTRQYPEQFVRYQLGENYYYSTDALTKDEGYSATDDGKQMVYLGKDGLLLLYDVVADTLTPVGEAQYDGRNAADYGKGWVIDFALSGDGKYLVFTSNRRTFVENATFEIDLWLRDMKSGEEKILQENVSIYSDLYFVGNQVFYCARNSGEETFSYIGLDVVTGQDITLPWDQEYSYVDNGCIVGAYKVYDIGDSRTSEFDSTLADSVNTGVLSTDKSNVAVLYLQEERLFINVVNLSDNSSILYRLPEEFNENFMNFKLICMDGNRIVMQCSTDNNDRGGSFTFYYVLDLTYILENK